jgi:serine/threonine protein kinase
MADEKTCPHCGKPVPPTTLGGICPECMLKAGLATQTEGPGGAGPHGTKVIHPPPSTAEIASLFPQLEILECLGRGGMGVVYRARQPRLNRLVALKILARDKEQDAQFAERFTREAQALARLNHPNIVTVYDFGTVGQASRLSPSDKEQAKSETGETPALHYLVMEFVDGLNLRQLLQTRKMKPEQALTIVPKICEALQYAHEQGIVHRDIKPENILLDKSGRVKIADFGIAKMMGDETGQQTFTGAREAVGTPHYMAPEQIEKPLTVDHRADIYSLGVVFYEMLTGELPLGKFQPPSAKVQIDVRLDEVVLHALEKEPERRYQQVSEVKTQLDTIASTSAPGTALARSAGEILARDYTLNIRHCLRRGWTLVRNDFWPLVGMSAFVLAVLSAAPSSGMALSNGQSSGTISILGILLGGPLMGGLYLYFLKKIRREATGVETAFTGFRQPFPHLVIAGFLASLLTGLGFLCLILPGIYLFVAWILTFPLIVDQRLDFWPAMRLSRKVISKHWWKFLGFLIVLGLINLAGLLACFIGLLVTFPITFAALTYAYEDIVGAVKSPVAASPSVPPVAAARSALRRGVLTGLTVFLVIVVLAIGDTLLLPRTYVGIALVRMTGPPAAQDPYHFQTESEVIHSQAVLEPVAAALNLSQRWGRKFNGGQVLSDDETIVWMKRMIEIQPVNGSSVIEIRCSSDSPKEAAEIANKIAETYCARPPEHTGEIIDRAIPPWRPYRPDVPLNIFIGVLTGLALGTFAGLITGLVSFWCRRKLPPPPVHKPDHFWRRFAVTVLTLIILIPAAIAILIIGLRIAANFVVDRQTQKQNQPANEPIRSDYIGQAWFPQGDSIEITSVERTENQMTVKGHYHLVSHEKASLALYITTTNDAARPTASTQEMEITKGNGDFALIDPNFVPGMPHVSMYADGKYFAALYFGTQAEALEESRASWITNASTASTLQFRLVLPQDSTEPADDLPSASGNNRFHLSRQVLLDDADVAQAGVDFSPDGRRKVEIRFTDAGAQRFEEITATNIGRQLAIVFRGQVLSAPVIQSVIPGGECQVDGSMNASEIDQIVDCLNRTATPTAEAWNFSPIHERILPLKPQPDALFGWLDLDSGMVLTNSSLDWQTRSGHDWIQAHGLDVVATESSKNLPTLLGLDTIIASAPTNGWDMVTAADVIHNWAFLQNEPQQKQVFGVFPGQTDTFFFQTREGGKGILQILGFADNSRGVKIRYRLVQSTNSSAEIAAQTLAEQPPIVVETFPVSGAREVEPGVTELRVRFSKPMADGSWSWSTAWQDSTPESIEPPHYLADQRTCVMKVRLDPGRTYGWWLNSEKFKNFTDQAGQPAVPYLLTFQTRQN